MRETDGACSTVVCGFIQIYDGWKGRLVANGERVGETMGGKRGHLSVQERVSGRGRPSTAVLLFELIVFYFSTLLCVVLFCRLLRRASLPSH